MQTLNVLQLADDANISKSPQDNVTPQERSPYAHTGSRLVDNGYAAMASFEKAH